MNADFIEQWKRDAAAAIKEYARVHHPFKIKKLSGYYLFIDTQSYYGVSSRPQKFFEFKRKGRLRAYGITQFYLLAK